MEEVAGPAFELDDERRFSQIYAELFGQSQDCCLFLC